MTYLHTTSMFAFLVMFTGMLPSAVVAGGGDPAASQQDANAEAEAAESGQKDDRIGKRVIVIDAGAPLRTPDKIVWKAYLGETFTVALTNGEWLWISEKGGWLWEQQSVLFDEAIPKMTQRVQEDPTAENHHLRGVAYLAHEQYDKAIADFTESLKLKPAAAGVLNNRGQAYYLKGEHASAINDFNSALRADPKHFVAMNNRALSHIATEDFDAALRDLNAAIRLNKDYPEALNNRGVVHSRQGDYNAAVADFTAALKVDDAYADAYGNRSFAYRQLKRFDEAVADLRTAMAKNTVDYKPVNDLAWLLATASETAVRQPAEAVKLATEACEMTQYEDWNTLDTLAAAYAADGDFKLAQQWIATAIEKAPESGKAELQQHQELILAEKPIVQ